MIRPIATFYRTYHRFFQPIRRSEKPDRYSPKQQKCTKGHEKKGYVRSTEIRQTSVRTTKINNKKKQKKTIITMKPHREENDELWVREKFVTLHEAFEDIVLWEV